MDPRHALHFRFAPTNNPWGWSAVVCSWCLIAFTATVSLAEEPTPEQKVDPVETPLHVEIDRLIAKALEEKQIVPAIRADDAEFLRRPFLDLVGRIPTVEEAQKFLEDQTPDKREKLIDWLLSSDEYARHMGHVFDVILMERRTARNVALPEWKEYLRQSFAENKPWDQLCREILAADDEDEQVRPAGLFYLNRDVETNLLTRDVARLFLGRDVQCSQCHDHPIVDDYLQEDYYGLYAFLNRSFLFAEKAKDKKPARSVLAEKAEGDVTYKSVFDPKVNGATGPHLPGDKALDEPKFDKGQEYEVAPTKDVRPVPKYSRRARLAEVLPRVESRAFCVNIANRLWAHMLGRGLVHPLDLHHSGNPPTHPELLDLLADRLAAMKFDIKAFLRQLALSETYQRSSESPGDQRPAPETFAVAPLKGLSAEQLALSMMQATGFVDVQRATLAKDKSEAALRAKLAANVNVFVTTFGGPAGQPEGDFQSSLDQVLFLAHGNLVQTWLAPQGGNLVDRLMKSSEPDRVADELYLSVLSRRPGAEERIEVVDHLRDRSQDRLAALKELIWGLLASSEFRFNH